MCGPVTEVKGQRKEEEGKVTTVGAEQIADNFMP